MSEIGWISLYAVGLLSTAVLRWKHREWKSRKHLLFNQDELLGTSRRSVSLLLGVAIGDSFGAGLEMQDYAVIERAVPGVDRYVNMRPTREINYLAGYYTDDTEMTVGLMWFLIDYLNGNGLGAEGDEQRIEQLMLQSWKKEYQHTNTISSFVLKNLLGLYRAGHGSFKYYVSGRRTLKEMRELNSEARRRYPGNGPVMRALPLSFVKDERLMIRLSRANANTTHPHVKARAASLITVIAARLFIFEKENQSNIIMASLEKYLQICKENADHFDQETFEYLQMVDGLPDYRNTGLDQARTALCKVYGDSIVIPWASSAKGQVRGLDADAMRTVGVILYLLKHYRTHVDSLLQAVHIGGDVDSVAAVLLGILCARFGLRFEERVSTPSGLPSFFALEMEGVDYLIDIASKFSASVESETF